MARVTALLLLAAACAHAPPDWLMRGSGSEDGALLGVGVAGEPTDPALRQREADARARAEIARLVADLAVAVAKDCGAWPGGSAAAPLSSVEIRDRWTDGESSASLAALDRDRLFDAWQAPEGVRACARQGWQKLTVMPR